MDWRAKSPEVGTQVTAVCCEIMLEDVGGRCPLTDKRNCVDMRQKENFPDNKGKDARVLNILICLTVDAIELTNSSNSEP